MSRRRHLCRRYNHHFCSERVSSSCIDKIRIKLFHLKPSGWLAENEAHPLITGSVFHYEFEFIHPFADGNGRMGRLWQSLILARWNLLFAHIPLENLVFQHQTEYYQALQESTRRTDSAPFITFMLRMIQDAVALPTPEVTPEVRLLSAFTGEMTRRQLQAAMGLKDDEHFRKTCLLPALKAGWIEMTIPGKPRSSRQKYRLTDKGRRRLLQDGREGPLPKL